MTGKSEFIPRHYRRAIRTYRNRPTPPHAALYVQSSCGDPVCAAIYIARDPSDKYACEFPRSGIAFCRLPVPLPKIGVKLLKNQRQPELSFVAVRALSL